MDWNHSERLASSVGDELSLKVLALLTIKFGFLEVALKLAKGLSLLGEKFAEGSYVSP